ncbi:hypothetical protein PRIPAC_86547, partial [Pristionchus pacificus]|uniref:Piwi domain-containing protein n=1 Tax=Pristionchus pacificus TaxID=54126 RepID=A0A2A6BNM6_PRIPA
MRAKTNFDTRFLAFEEAAHITTLFIITDFARNFVTAAKAKGMQIDHVQHYVMDPTLLYKHMVEIYTLKKTDPKLKNMIFLHIEPESNKHHDELKLFERRFCMITQHLKMENAAQLAGKKMMMENILLKLNVKGGGHNHYVTPEIYAMPLWMEKQIMIMGYNVCHPTGQSRADKMADRLPDPSVVGFSFNGGVNPDSFIGDYHYQQATRERKSRGVLPPLIIVVRDGISDGQHSHAMDELETLREAAAEYASPVDDYTPHFIFVVATKRHHKRVYADGERGLTNMAAMSVVDDTITDPSLFEFYMQSHTPIQGTAKPTRYTVLKNDVGATQDAMQSLMGALCFEHQISTNAISIPEPVYQSDEWAKRGANNMRIIKQMFGEKGQLKKGFTYDDLTNSLSYWNSPLEK